MSKPFLTLCMIVKNEEKVLRRCLESVKGVVDEVVIVDTGSTDRTKEIASEYTNKIYDYEWRDSFADARNFAQTKATGSWILVMDADEYVDPENLKKAKDEIKNSSHPVDAYVVKIYNFTGMRGERIVHHHSLRLYRNEPSITFYRSIHEQLKKTDGELQTDTSSLILYHSGYLSKTVSEKGKLDRNQRLLEKEIHRSGHTGFDYFNLGNELLGRDEIEKALEAFIQAYKKKPDFRYSWVSMTVVQIVNCLIRLKRYEDALAVIHDAEPMYPQSSDFKCLRANIYSLQHRYEDAIIECEELIERKDDYSYPIASIDYTEYFPHEMLGTLYKKRGDLNKSVYHLVKALHINRKSVQAMYHLLSLLTKHCTKEDVDTFLQRENLLQGNDDQFIVIKSLINLYQPDLASKYLKRMADSVVKRALEIKLNLLTENYKAIEQALQKETLENLLRMIQLHGIDVYDLLIYGMMHQQDALLVIIEQLASGKEEKDFVRFLLTSEADGQLKKEHYLNLLERCIQTRQFQLFEKLLNHRHMFESDINLSIGHLLYRYRFTDLAISFYQMIGDFADWDDNVFANIIESFVQHNEWEDAVHFVMLAIDQGRKDYRILQKGIELFKEKQLHREMNEMISIANKYYPDSRWLQQFRA